MVSCSSQKHHIHHEDWIYYTKTYNYINLCTWNMERGNGIIWGSSLWSIYLNFQGLYFSQASRPKVIKLPRLYLLKSAFLTIPEGSMPSLLLSETDPFSASHIASLVLHIFLTFHSCFLPSQLPESPCLILLCSPFSTTKNGLLN